ncbi:MAG TPA: alpha/beta hydrolase [Hyalangium sp.]|nr:alpha/beta hydrolase [Hyalangium sp.]
MSEPQRPLTTSQQPQSTKVVGLGVDRSGLSDGAPEGRARSEFRPVQLHTVKGAGGVELCVAEAGNPQGPAVLFVHGFCQSHQAWQRQLHSSLGLDFRLVALDLRGHGRSGKPETGYIDSRLWAEDLHAVITTLRLERPVLVGWSYGGVVVIDYLRHFGQANVAGVHLVGALSRLGKPEAFADLAPDFLQLIPGLLSPEANESQSAIASFTSLLFHSPQTPAVLDEVRAYNQQVPHPVRLGVGQRVEEGEEVLAALKIPLLVSHGLEDRVVLPESGRHISSLVKHAELSRYPDVGHSPFWESTARFNQELSRFVARCRG